MLEELCDLIIKNKINITWGGQAAIRDGMKKELILKMKEAGCFHLTYGLESVSPKILKMIGKEFSPELAERVIRDTHQAGIKTYATLIVGFPTETDEDIIMTSEFLARNRQAIDKVLFHPLVIARGTYIYEKRDYFGIELEDDFNSVRWHSNKEINTLEKRLEVLEFYNKYLGKEEESFYAPADYCLFLADKYFEKRDYKEALKNYRKALEVNNNLSKDKFIKDKVALTHKISQDQL